MLRLLVFFLGMAAVVSAGAQANDTAVVAVRYSFHYVMDTTQPGDVTSENMVLFIGQKTSVFKSYDKYLRDSAMRVQFEKQVLTPGGTRSIVSPQGMRVGMPTAFYKDPVANKLNQLELFLKYYLIDEAMPSIDWNISQDTKEIQGLVCQKATTLFRGRRYTAWFTNQLPYSNGPWKLGGLPGLILEAADEKNEVVFGFDAFENVAGRNIAISTPPDAIATTMKDYRRLRDAALKDPQSVTGNSVGEAMFKATRTGPSAPAPVKRKVNNNPIEKIS